MNPPPELVPDRPAWAVDPAHAARQCAAFVHDAVAAAQAAGVVVGLSGGLDSAVAAAVAVQGIGAERVRAVALPYRQSAPSSLADAELVAARLGLRLERFEITGPVDAFLATLPGADALRRGNVMARSRMVVLHDLSRRDGSLVLGTGNRTEWLLGYTTLYGDAAYGLNPIGQLYKTEVRLLAHHLGLPREVLVKAPSADLWAGQTDEDEMGFTYAQADRLLHHLVDERLEPRQLASLGFAPGLVEQVGARMRATAFKRVPPPVCSFGRPDGGP